MKFKRLKKSSERKVSPDITKCSFGTEKGAQNHTHLRTMTLFLYPKVTWQINVRIEMETQKV